MWTFTHICTHEHIHVRWLQPIYERKLKLTPELTQDLIFQPQKSQNSLEIAKSLEELFAERPSIVDPSDASHPKRPKYHESSFTGRKELVWVQKCQLLNISTWVRFWALEWPLTHFTSTHYDQLLKRVMNTKPLLAKRVATPWWWGRNLGGGGVATGKLNRKISKKHWKSPRPSGNFSLKCLEL